MPTNFLVWHPGNLEGENSEGQPDIQTANLQEVQEQVWSGYQTQRWTTVEEVDNKDDPVSSGESGGSEPDDGYINMSSTSASEDEDEYTAIFIWDELAEGVL